MNIYYFIKVGKLALTVKWVSNFELVHTFLLVAILRGDFDKFNAQSIRKNILCFIR